MAPLVKGIIFYVSTFVVLGGVGLVWDMWRHRDCFEIAARCPVLLCQTGTAFVGLVFMQMIAEVAGDDFPCVLVIWTSYLSFGTIVTTNLLRASRIVVVYNRDLRRKYQRLVAPQFQRKCIAVALGLVSLVALVINLMYYLRSDTDQHNTCRFFEEKWSFFFPVTVIFLAAVAGMAHLLKTTNDVFNIRNEIGYSCLATAITSVTRTLHASAECKIWFQDLNLDVEMYPTTIHDLVACALVLYFSFFKPLKAFYGIGSRTLFGEINSARRIYSGGGGKSDKEDDHHENRHHHKGWGDERKPETWGVLQILESSTLSAMLITYCEKSLCGESVDFLVDITVRYEPLSNPEEQFEMLNYIVNNYLVVGAANEVNVSDAHRSAAAGWLSKKDKFFALEEKERVHILDRQRDEIAKVLEENLLVKFKKTELAMTAMRALKEVAAGEATEEQEGNGQGDDGMRMMLQASAALEVARVQRITRNGTDDDGHGKGIGGTPSATKSHHHHLQHEKSRPHLDSQWEHVLSSFDGESSDEGY